MAKNKNRIPVFLLTLLPTQHQSSRNFAARLVADALAEYVNDADPRLGIRLLTHQDYLGLRAHYKCDPSGLKPVPRILPPRDQEPLLLSYPPHPQESDGARRQRELWLRAERF